MLEYRTVRVEPDQVDRCTLKLQKFGWKLEQFQIVYNQTPRAEGQSARPAGEQTVLDGYDGERWEPRPRSKADPPHYAVLRFSRNAGMRNYAEIRDLETEYCGVERELLQARHEQRHAFDLGVLLWCLIAVTVVSGLAAGILLLLVPGTPAAVWCGCAFGVLLIAAIGLGMGRGRKNRAKYDLSREKETELKGKLEKILQRAAALIPERPASPPRADGT